MIPYKDENPTHRLPVVVYGIILLNLAAWFFLQGFGEDPVFSESVCFYGVTPNIILSGGNITELDCQSLTPVWLTTLTSMFVHGGWLHLIGNLWFLWIFGDNVEDAMDRHEFILFYLIGGIAAVATQIAFNIESVTPMVGASGAIGGVMGAYARLYPNVRVHLAIVLGFFIIRRTLSAFTMLSIWLVMQALFAYIALFNGAANEIAFGAHIGGFLTGFVLIALFKNKVQK